MQRDGRERKRDRQRDATQPLHSPWSDCGKTERERERERGEKGEGGGDRVREEGGNKGRSHYRVLAPCTITPLPLPSALSPALVASSAPLLALLLLLPLLLLADVNVYH